MAANLVKAGFSVHVWNRSPEPMSELVAAGASAVAAAHEVAQRADVLISMLADDEATNAVILESGVLDAMKAGALHINMATVSVACSRDLLHMHEDRGTRYIAAPVLGRVDVAQAGRLNILAAGNADAIREAQPIFDVLGQKTWLIGDRPEQANAVKLAINTMIAGAIAQMSESAALTQRYGVPEELFIELITSTGFAAPVYRSYGPAIAQQRFEPVGFKLELGLKDVRLTLEAAEPVHVPMPLAGVLREQHLDSLAHGEGHLDWAALSRVAMRRSGQA